LRGFIENWFDEEIGPDVERLGRIRRDVLMGASEDKDRMELVRDALEREVNGILERFKR
jgi:hypothetical protein